MTVAALANTNVRTEGDDGPICVGRNKMLKPATSPSYTNLMYTDI